MVTINDRERKWWCEEYRLKDFFYAVVDKEHGIVLAACHWQFLRALLRCTIPPGGGIKYKVIFCFG